MKLAQSLVVLSITLLYAMTWSLAGFPKLFGGGVPPWFGETFGNTFLASFPGLWLSFYSIAVGEVIAALLAIGSLLRREFLEGRDRPLFIATLVVSLFLFLQLGFGKRLIADHEGAAQLFYYFIATLIPLSLVLERRPQK